MKKRRSLPNYLHSSIFLVPIIVLALLLQNIIPVYAATGEWTLTGSMNNARRAHTATLLLDGKVLISGGEGSSGTIASTEIYNPSEGTWAETGSMNTARAEHSATLLSNGKVLVTGGNPSLASAELYDPATGIWTVTDSMNNGRYSHASILLPNGKVLVAGGWDYSGGTAINTAELYDPATGTWSITGSMNYARNQDDATLLPNGKVLVGGGEDYPGHYLANAELYDPDTGTWTSTGMMNTAHGWNSRQQLLPNGQVLLAGAATNPSVELYDLETDTWTYTGSMNVSRRSFIIASLLDGKVLAAGGNVYSGSPYINSAELYDRTTGTWTYTSSMNAARNGHTATLLSNGNVLVAGGGNSEGRISSAELYIMETVSPDVMVEQAEGQSDPTNTGPINFTATFSETVTGFDSNDVDFAGSTASGTLSALISGTGPTYTISVTGMHGSGTIMVSIPAGVAQGIAGKNNNASTSIDNTVTYKISNPTANPNSLQKLYKDTGPNKFEIIFTGGVYDPPGNDDPDDVTNPDNYILVERGANKRFDTATCIGRVKPDDIQIPIISVTYDNSTFTSNVVLVSPIKPGFYRMFLCATTSIVDLDRNPINGGEDFTFDFRVLPEANALPTTGFAYGRLTALPAMADAKAYTSTDMILEVASLGIKTQVVGVPQNDDGWDVTWLGENVGYLYGSAYPTWAGNTVLTGHVWNADNTPGIFANLRFLKYGDQFTIHNFGQVYTYEVRKNKLFSSINVPHVFKHEEFDWVTLLTCELYNPLSDSYVFHRVVRAVLVSVK